MAERLVGMILAAGYGTRLAPLTDRVPKPLLPVGERVLIDHAIDACDRVGAAEVGVNTHHLGGMIAAHLTRRPDADRFRVFAEPDILGTGGALDGARDFLSAADLVLLYNGDVLCDVDPCGLAAEHRRSGALATLLLVDWPAINSVDLAADGRILRLAGRGSGAPEDDFARGLTYTGIAMLAPGLLDHVPAGVSSLIDVLLDALEADRGAVRGWAPEDVRWSDLGTLGSYLAAQPAAAGPAPGDLQLERLAGHGSDRRFWRVRAGTWSAVAMANPADDGEHERFMAVTRFLNDGGLGTAAVLREDPQGRAVLLEDLGEEHLYEIVQKSSDEPSRVDLIYQRAVDWLAKLQATTDSARQTCRSAVDRCLDRDALRWETRYFQERFLKDHLGHPTADISRLDTEFDTLANVVANIPQYLIHRDFQSQNLLMQGETLRVVDVQGMRLGPQTYDLASLVWDPYVNLPHDLNQALIARFAARKGLDAQEIVDQTYLAALQRLMQALGAFGYLGEVKGKRAFLTHIPRALANLSHVLQRVGAQRDAASGADWGAPELPRLTALITHLAADRGPA